MEDCGIDYRFLREKGTRLIIYLDDILILCEKTVKLKGQLTLLKELFQALGLVINWEKSQFEPTQEILFLGFWISTKSMTASLPREKLRKIMQEAHQLSQRASVSLQEIAGKTTATRQAIRVAPLFHQHLQALINRVIPFAASKEELQSCYQEIVPLSPEELFWWSQQAERWNFAQYPLILEMLINFLRLLPQGQWIVI